MTAEHTRTGKALWPSRRATPSVMRPPQNPAHGRLRRVGCSTRVGTADGSEARRGEAGVAAAGVGRHTQRNWDAPRMLRPCGGYPQCAMQGRRWAREYQDAFFVRTPPNSFPQSQQFFSLHAGHCLSAPLNMHRDVWNSGKKCEHSGEKCSSTNLIAYLDGPDKQCWACTCCMERSVAARIS